MSGNIDRIRAQTDMRALTLSNVSQSAEAAHKYRERLEIETGTLVKVAPVSAITNAVRDEAGFAQLKEMARQRVGI